MSRKRSRTATATVQSYPAERRQHGRVTLATEQVADAHGAIGVPYRAETLLERMERGRDITPQERAAGEEFQRLFRLAELDELRASDPARVIVSGGDSNAITARSEHARGRIRDAVQAVGGQNSAAGLVCWYVLGLELSLREFEQREGWSPRRPLSREASKGALVGALGVLEKFFGMT